MEPRAAASVQDSPLAALPVSVRQHVDQIDALLDQGPVGNEQALTAMAGEAMAALESREALDALRVHWLGRKEGKLTLLKRGLKDLDEAGRRALGEALHLIGEVMEQGLVDAGRRLEAAAMAQRLEAERLDVTMPGIRPQVGKAHPITTTIQDVVAIFRQMGFQALDPMDCPEVETDYYNFDALNFRPDHPAREMQDTFYTQWSPQVLLRSQTSNAQIRHMETHTPPFAIVAPGRVYRNEEVTSRKYVLFHQVEGLWVDEKVTFADLKGVLHQFVTLFFGGERPTRFRASYFPFTEPSAEMDVQCIFCNGEGCRVCSHSGWLEVLGCGLVHPNVLRGVGIDPERYQGFAFGLGVERMTMLRAQVNDIRLFYQNDARFLGQF